MISEKQLRLAAKELIEDVCALRDDKTKKPIVINSDMSIEDITTLFKNAITLIEPTDKFSDSTKSIIDEISADGTKNDQEVAEEIAEVVELTLAEEIKSCETLKQLKAIVLVEDSFKSIKGKLSSYKKVEDLKEAMSELLKDEEEEAQKKAEELHKKNIADAPVRTGRGKPATEKKEEEPAEEKKEKKPAEPGKKTTLAEKIDFFTPLIKSAKYTQKDLVELAVKEFPKLTKSTFQTFLTDGKNDKYSKFKPLLATNADGKMIFAKK